MNIKCRRFGGVRYCVALAACIASLAGARATESERPLDQLNGLGYGIWDARVQSISMYRDFENNDPGNAYVTTIGLRLGYASPEIEGFSGAVVWDYVEPAHASDSSDKGKTTPTTLLPPISDSLPHTTFRQIQSNH